MRRKNLQLIVDRLKLDSESFLLNLQRRFAIVLDEVDVNRPEAVGPGVRGDDPEGDGDGKENRTNQMDGENDVSSDEKTEAKAEILQLWFFSVRLSFPFSNHSF